MDQAPADTFESLSEAIVAFCGHIHGAEYRLIELIRHMKALNTTDRLLVTSHASAEALPEHANADHKDPPWFEYGSLAAQGRFAPRPRGVRVPRGYSSRLLPGHGATAPQPP